MAGRNVNIWIDNWTDLQNTVPFPQYGVDVRLEWTGADDQPHEHENTYTFPNVLQNVPLSRLRRYMEEIILREARLALNIDEED